MAKKQNKQDSDSSLEERLRLDITKAMKEEIFYPYKFKFRSSKLPFCPREYAIHHRLDRESQALYGESYQFNFYVKIGTAVHEVIQTFLGISGLLYGDWECCGVVEHSRAKSDRCPVCGYFQKYKELAPSVSELGMHVDGVNLKHNFVWEFKTTSGKNIDKLSGPYPQHLIQASCYLHALNEQYSWNIKKLVFVYLSRDNPNDFRLFVRDPIPLILQETLELYREIKSALSKKDDLPLPVCAKPSEGEWRGCNYAGICFSPSLSSMLIPASSLIR